MTNPQLIDFVSKVTLWIGDETDSVSETYVSWITRKGEFFFDYENMEFRFIDSTIDSKTYFALLALCASYEITTGDYTNKK